MKRDRKGGRPRKGAAEKLNYKITVKLCTQDYYSVKAASKTAGIRPAELARAALLGMEIKPRVTPEEAGWLRMLSGMANNLNQLARQAHKSGYNDLRSANITLGLDIHNLIKRFRHDSQNNKG